jgi:hypothetical protein
VRPIPLHKHKRCRYKQKSMGRELSGYDQFQINYEKESERIFNELSRLTEDDLLGIIGNRLELKYGVWKGRDNYEIWRAFRIKGTQKSIKPLFDIVSNLSIDYLIRYHACDALFSIAGIRDSEFKGKVQYGRDRKRNEVDQLQAISALGQILKIEAKDIRIITKRPWWKF